MAKLFLLFITVLMAITVSSQNFEGEITFQRMSDNDTLYFTYFIKYNFVRVDEFSKDKSVQSSLIINLEDSSLIAISPARKMYMYMPVQPFYSKKSDDIFIDKSDETKSMFEYDCNKWTVESTSLNTVVEYFVANDDFNFLIPFLNITNRTEKSAEFFLYIMDNEGYFPMKSIEKPINGNGQKLILEVTNIAKKKLNQDLFNVPSDYMLFQH